MTTTTHYAAIDATNITGAVYGIGTTAREARGAAQIGRGQTAPLDAHFGVVPCTPAAAAYVESHGGAPSPRLTVTARGVCLRSEEE